MLEILFFVEVLTRDHFRKNEKDEKQSSNIYKIRKFPAD
jgi:hypothetical protein